MTNPATQLIARLATGDGDSARAYLTRLAVKVRSHTVAEVRAHVRPEHWALFVETAPWLERQEPRDLAGRLVQILREAGRAGLNRTQLQERLRRIPASEMDAELERLVSTMEVHIQNEPTRGRTAERFRLADFAGGIAAANEMQNPFARRPSPEFLGEE